ncbi:MAG TPA: peroxiredoxin-like family protein [Terriglobales bacterium]|nr:peroxiredoxin-like family protein [Terriglobales bacterium]
MKWRSLTELHPVTEARPLREIFAERKELIANYVPADLQAVHSRTVAGLKAQAFAAHALKAGANSPSFELPDHNGKLVSSANLLRQGRLVLIFIRGRWCPFCVAQMEAMSSIAPEIAATGAALVAVSPQTEKQAFFMHDQHKLAFPLLVDAQNALARQFGLVYRVPQEQQSLYSRTFVNLPFANGDSSWELPIPATYVIDCDGRILFASANEDYSDRPEPVEIAEAVRLTRDRDRPLPD